MKREEEKKEGGGRNTKGTMTSNNIYKEEEEDIASQTPRCMQYSCKKHDSGTMGMDICNMPFIKHIPYSLSN